MDKDLAINPIYSMQIELTPLLLLICTFSIVKLFEDVTAYISEPSILAWFLLKVVDAKILKSLKFAK